jgi:hypothetical protein
MQNFNIEDKVNEWRLFIDSTKRSLKVVLLHNGNNQASLPIGHSVHFKESYENLELVLTKIGYTAHDWMICGDLKQKHWTPRTSLETGSKNILRRSLVDPKKMLLPPLHMKLGIMKQFAKNWKVCQVPLQNIPHLSKAKLKAGVFVGPDIRKLMFNEYFLLAMTEVEREAWIAFKSVVTKFLGNNKDPDYVTILANMLEKFKVLGCLMSLKIRFLNLHLDFSPENLGSVSEEQGERFHQDIK